jgi:subtilisin family serine protease
VASNLEVDVLVAQGSVVNPMPATSMADPAAHPFAFTVGAVNVDGYLDNDVQGFSSQGPARSGALKPDIAGPDGLSVSAYGASGFFGTSAATPAVAGALALVMSRYPELTPRQASQRLTRWALSDSPDSWDPRWGAGKVRLPVVEPAASVCGRRPMWAGLLLPPVLLLRRRRRR